MRQRRKRSRKAGSHWQTFPNETFLVVGGGDLNRVLLREAKRLKVILRNPRFGVVLVLLALCIIHHYPEQIGLSTTLFPDSFYGLTRHTVDRMFYLVPIIYAGYIFGATIGLAVTLISLLLMLPQALFISSSPPDALFETALVISIGVLATLWLRARAKQMKAVEEREQATAAMVTAQEKLRSQIRNTMKCEKKLTTLGNISDLLTQSLDSKSLRHSAIEMVMELMGVEVVLLFALEEKTRELVLTAYEGVPQKFVQSVGRIRLGEGFNGQVAETGEPLLVEDASKDSGLSGEAARQENLQAQLIVPMRAGGRVVGTLCVAMRQHREFNVGEIELLTAIGNEAGIAIENARLYQEQLGIAAQLRQSEKNYRELFENAPDAIWIHDLEGNILAANRASEILTGFSIEELSNMNVRRFLSPESLEIAGEIRHRLLQGQVVTQPYEQHLKRRNGTEATLMLATNLISSDGQPTGFQNIARDITEEKRMEEQIRVQKAYFESIFQHSPEGMVTLDINNNILDANVGFENIFGYRLEEIKGRRLADLIVPERLYYGEAKELDRMALDGILGYETIRKKKDGTEIDVSLSAGPIKERGELRGRFAVFRDITEHKRAETELKEAKDRLSEIVDGIAIPAFAIDKRRELTSWNAALEALSGVKREQVIGTSKQWLAFYSHERPVMADLIIDGGSEDEIRRYYGGKYKKSPLIEGAYEVEDFFSTLGEEGRWLHFTAAPIRSEAGEVIAVIETLEDITERKRMEENLRFYVQQITKAQEEERLRIARELHDSTAQTLIALLHQLENLLREKAKLPVGEAKELWAFHEQIKGLLQEVRYLSRDLRPSILDDIGLLATLRWMIRELKTEYGIEASLQMHGAERRFPQEVELILFRIVQEALRNIGRHSQASKAEVLIRFEEEKTTVTIKDNGIGFELPDKLGDLSRSGKLGLVGMQERVRLLDGNLEVKSEPGKGTTVIVEAPI